MTSGDSPSRLRGVAFQLALTAVISFFSWAGFNRLAVARSTGRFEFLWHGIDEESWPTLFFALKGFLVVWSWVAALLAVISGIVLFIMVLKRVLKFVKRFA